LYWIEILMATLMLTGNTKRFTHQRLASLSTLPMIHTPRSRFCEWSIWFLRFWLLNWPFRHLTISSSVTSSYLALPKPHFICQR
jgi:hypothetical protein